MGLKKKKSSTSTNETKAHIQRNRWNYYGMVIDLAAIVWQSEIWRFSHFFNYVEKENFCSNYLHTARLCLQPQPMFRWPLTSEGGCQLEFTKKRKNPLSTSYKFELLRGILLHLLPTHRASLGMLVLESYRYLMAFMWRAHKSGVHLLLKQFLPMNFKTFNTWIFGSSWTKQNEIRYENIRNVVVAKKKTSVAKEIQ